MIKFKLLLILILSATLSHSQNNLLLKNNQLYFGSDTIIIKIDTIKCIMLVCDTQSTVRAAYWIYGYSYGISYWNYTTSFYLDEKKKPLSESIIVWMSKDIEYRPRAL